jgi:hypothetical protein
MQKARRQPTKGLRPLVSARFQVLFTPLSTVLFTFPSRYLFTIGLSGVFSLAGWCRQIQAGFHLSRPTQDTAISSKIAGKGLSPAMASFPKEFPFSLIIIMQSYNPTAAVTAMVWANPVSLATTKGITVVFFSSGYLDVSVPQVTSLYKYRVLRLHRSGLTHSDTHGSIRICQSPWIFAAYRVLHRL